MRETIKIGWASENITPDRPILLNGQLYPRVSKYVHDPITATALALESAGAHCVMVSLDMAFITKALCDRIRMSLADVPGLDPAHISFSCIHTHNSTSFEVDAFMERFKELLGDGYPPFPTPDDLLTGEEATAFAVERIGSVVRRAWQSREPGGVSAAQDYAAVGFNRRPVFEREDGTRESVMYGCCDDPAFVRFEGTVDHSVNALFTWDMCGRMTGVAVGVPCPSQVMELHSFVSADFWTNARAHLRASLGDALYVLPLCEAAGDLNPLDLVRISKTNHAELARWNAQADEVWCNYDLAQECDKIGARIASAVTLAASDARKAIEYQPVFRYEKFDCTLPIRKVSEEDGLAAKRELDALAARFDAETPATTKDLVAMYEPIGIYDRWLLQQSTDEFVFAAAAVRIGGAVLSFNPFELYIDYALRIRARARAKHVFMAQLTDDYSGYLPTREAVEGGSYSSKPASTLIGPEGGERMLDAYLKAMDGLMAN